MATQATTVATAVSAAQIAGSIRSPELGVVELFGSFQGKGTSDPSVLRGNWFSVTRVSAGLYRVQCTLPIPTLIVAGAPSGLISEPFAWITSETVATMPAVSTGFAWQLCCSCYDVTTHANTFDITTGLMTDATPPVVWTATDVQTTDRVNFRLAFKNTAVVP